MNTLILLPNECFDATRAVASGYRAAYLLKMHELSTGITIRAGLYGGKRGLATVVSIGSDQIEFSLQLDEEPLARFHTELVVAVARPQSVKRIVAFAAMSGLSHIHFVRSANTEKSYLSSKALMDGDLQEQCLRGLEQAGDTIPPEIFVHSRFRPFIEDVLPQRLSACGPDNICLLGAKIDSAKSLASIPFSRPAMPVFFAIGPELGWNEFECQSFIAKGFEAVHLGERMLRVDIAVVSLAAQIAFAREQCGGVGQE